MTSTETWAGEAGPEVTEAWEDEAWSSPFVGAEAEALPGPGLVTGGDEWSTSTDGPHRSPFTGAAPEAELSGAFDALVRELAAPELPTALGEVVLEAAGLHAEHLALGGTGEVGDAAARIAASVVERNLELLVGEAETYVSMLAEVAGDATAGELTDRQVDGLLDRFEVAPVPGTGSVAFEEFLRSLKRVAGRVVKGAVSLARKGIAAVGTVLPIGQILRRIGALVRPLLRRVLTAAIGRLPIALQPAARQLRKRLFGAEAPAAKLDGEVELLGELAAVLESDPVSGPAELAAVPEVETMAEEFAASAARLLLAADELEADVVTQEAAVDTAGAEAEGPTGEEIDAARFRLITELSRLQDGESAAPAIEQFLPAVLPVLRIGVRLAGRARVVGFLAGLLAKLLARFVGPQLSRPLSQAIVDAGLRLIALEAPTGQEVALAGPTAVAAVVEDTAQRLAGLHPEVFEEPFRLEAEVIAAFEESVAHNVPPALLRADLAARETASGTAVWAMRPRVHWYRKYTRVFDVTLTPQMAASLTTFGGVPLTAFLRATQPVTRPTKVRVHLYETFPGTYLSRIASLEGHVPGMRPDGWRRFHPLTVAAAGTLLGEPGLGRDVASRFLRDRATVTSGQRLYYLEFVSPPAGPGRIVPGVPSQMFLTVDARPGRNLLVAFVYLSEADAQAIAARARANNTMAFAIALRAGFQAAVTSVRLAPRTRVTVLREAEDEAAAGLATAVGSKVVDTIVGKVVDALVRLASDYAKDRAAQFVKAADDPRPGVTVIITLPVRGLSTVLRGGLLGSVAGVGALATLLGTVGSARLLPHVTTVPGFRRS
jgi:hypothetical protein